MLTVGVAAILAPLAENITRLGCVAAEIIHEKTVQAVLDRGSVQ
jgi:hypothetical protein